MTASPQAYSVKQFCEAHQISKPHLYRLWQRGEGPRRMRVGDRTLIAAEAAAEWRQECEARAARDGAAG